MGKRRGKQQSKEVGWRPCYDLNSALFAQSLEGEEGVSLWIRDCQNTETANSKPQGGQDGQEWAGEG